jgi:hypothetical protein
MDALSASYTRRASGAVRLRVAVSAVRSRPYSVTRTLPAAMSAKFLRRLSVSLFETVHESVGKLSFMRGELSRFRISTSSEFPFFMMTRELLSAAMVALASSSARASDYRARSRGG